MLVKLFFGLFSISLLFDGVRFVLSFYTSGLGIESILNIRWSDSKV